MSDCGKCRSEIEESVAGFGLSDGALAHVESCGECGEFRRVRDSLSQLVRRLEKVEAPADFEFRLRARIASRKGGRGRTLFARLGPLARYTTVAAALCFMIISASLYFRQAQWRSPVGTQRSNSIVESANEPKQPLRKDDSEPTPASSPAVVNVTDTAATIKQNADKPRGRAQQHFREIVRIDEGRRVLANNSFSVYPAPVINRLRIPVNTSAEPLRVVLRDEQGVARVVQMRTVSFGSQELLAREETGRRASEKKNEGVW
jgi:hypothetical protein